MGRKEELIKLKKQRTRMLVIGCCIIPLGYAIMGLCMTSGNPLGILGMFTAFTGIIMILRSCIHIKYRGLDKALTEYEANPEMQYIPEDVDLGIMNVVRPTFEKYFEAYGTQLLRQQYVQDPTGMIPTNRINQTLSQIANLNQVDDESLFIVYAYLCGQVRIQNNRAVIQNECVFRTLYKRYSNSLERIKNKVNLA